MVELALPADLRVEDWVPWPGTVIDGRYRIEAVVGIGTMGAVVAARHLVLDCRVAIKFLRPDRAVDPTAVERFRQEASAASRIRTDHVVRIHDVGVTDEGLPYMVMELLEGSDLEKLAQRGPLSIQLAVDCVLQASEALAEAHVGGIVHRDIKPANLFVTAAPRRLRPDQGPRLRHLEARDRRGGDPSLTSTQAVIGSPAYMSPEQIRTAKYVDRQADVWALGVILFEILTTRLPFEGDTVGSVLAAVTMLPPASLRALRPDVSERVEAAVLACLEKDPAARATLGDLAAGLRPFATPLGIESADRVARICGTSTPSSLPPPQIPARREPGTTARVPVRASVAPGASRLGLFIVGAGLLALLAMVVVVALSQREPPRPLAEEPSEAAAPAPPPSLSVSASSAPEIIPAPTVSQAPPRSRRPPRNRQRR